MSNVLHYVNADEQTKKTQTYVPDLTNILCRVTTLARKIQNKQDKTGKCYRQVFYGKLIFLLQLK